MKPSFERLKKLMKTKYRLPIAISNFYFGQFLKFRKKSYAHPFWAQIEPTNYCNLKCKMCVQSTDPFLKRGFLSYEDFKIILGKLPFTIGLMLQGFGEPFLNKDLIKMIRYSSNKGYIVETTSNGTLITNSVAEKIITSGLDSITFSLDGAKKESYEFYRIGSNFENVVRNIKNLSELRKKKNSDLKIHINSIVTKRNYNELPSLVDLCGEMNIDEVFLGFMLVQGDFPIEFNTEQKIHPNESKLTNYLQKSLDKAKSLGLKMHVNAFYNGKCDSPWTRIYVNYDGTVTPCCVIIKKNNG
jgi:MoaA/NifB/PqqE/SkfB family radical SAM enzyme